MRRLVLVILSVYARSLLASEPQAMTQAQLAEKLHQYEAIKSLDATFKQTKTISDMNMKIRSEGRFKLTRPRDVLWEIEKPGHVVMRMNEKEVTIKNGDGADVKTQTYKLSDMPSGKMARSMEGLLAWLDLNAAELHKNYAVYPVAKDRFDFVPREKDVSPFKQLSMHLNGKGFVDAIAITENSGDTIDIEFGVPKIVKKE